MNKENFESLKRGMAQMDAFMAGDRAGAVVHTPRQIEARRGRGRPAGTTKPDTKQQVSLRLDPDVIAHFRATGPGWQGRINDALKAAIGAH